VAPILRSSLVKRFELKYRTEERPVSVYRLVAGKSKMKSRPCQPNVVQAIECPGRIATRFAVFSCQNITMAQFAEQLQGKTQELIWSVVDATGIESSWDFTLMFSPNAGLSGGIGAPGQSGSDESAAPIQVAPSRCSKP
jgi:uncharacterized protein (TIGR03435 family)